MKITTKILLLSLTLCSSSIFAEDKPTPVKPSPENVKAFKKHRKEIESLPPDERKAKMEQFIKDHPEAKERFEKMRKRHEEFEKLSPEEKQKKREEFMNKHPEMKEKFEEFKKTHPDFESKSPEEKREIMKKLYNEHSAKSPGFPPKKDPK